MEWTDIWRNVFSMWLLRDQYPSCICLVNLKLWQPNTSKDFHLFGSSRSSQAASPQRFPWFLFSANSFVAEALLKHKRQSWQSFHDKKEYKAHFPECQTKPVKSRGDTKSRYRCHLSYTIECAVTKKENKLFIFFPPEIIQEEISGVHKEWWITPKMNTAESHKSLAALLFLSKEEKGHISTACSHTAAVWKNYLSLALFLGGRRWQRLISPSENHQLPLGPRIAMWCLCEAFSPVARHLKALRAAK